MAELRGGGETWVDPDDAPEWTAEKFERADLYHGNKLVRAGRPPSANPKLALKLRIDPESWNISAPPDRAGKPASTTRCAKRPSSALPRSGRPGIQRRAVQRTALGWRLFIALGETRKERRLASRAERGEA